jgi:transposase
LDLIDMRKGLDGLTMPVQGVLRHDPFSGHLFVFRGRRANLIKIVYGTAPNFASSPSDSSKVFSSGPGAPSRAGR